MSHSSGAHAPVSRCCVEVRPGEGGADAAVFADELVAAVAAWSRRRGWELSCTSGVGRTTVVAVVGVGAQRLAGLAGCHRVQRIPKGSSKRHTSTALVAVLAAPTEAAVVVADTDLRVTVARGSGPGGQHRNKTESAVRVLHVPSGLTVVCQDSRSQGKNLLAARAEVSTRLEAAARLATAESRNVERVAQFTGSDRSLKSFTHNEQRGEVVDHATGRRWRSRDFARGALD